MIKEVIILAIFWQNTHIEKNEARRSYFSSHSAEVPVKTNWSMPFFSVVFLSKRK